MNPYNDMYFIFKRFSGYLLLVKGDGLFNYKGGSIAIFSWIHPFFLKKDQPLGLTPLSEF